MVLSHICLFQFISPKFGLIISFLCRYDSLSSKVLPLRTFGTLIVKPPLDLCVPPQCPERIGSTRAAAAGVMKRDQMPARSLDRKVEGKKRV